MSDKADDDGSCGLIWRLN